MKIIGLAFVLILICLLALFSMGIKDGYVPEEGFVPNKETAIKIAEAVWLPIYGTNIYDKLPFKARLVNGNLWIVEGTIMPPKKGYIVVGGVPYIEIRKSDCKILKVSHGK